MSLSFSVLFGAALFSFLALRFLTPIAFALSCLIFLKVAKLMQSQRL